MSFQSFSQSCATGFGLFLRDVTECVKTCVCFVLTYMHHLEECMTQSRYSRIYSYYYDVPPHYKRCLDYKYPFYHCNVRRSVPQICDFDCEAEKGRNEFNSITINNGYITENFERNLERNSHISILEQDFEQNVAETKDTQGVQVLRVSNITYAMLYDENREIGGLEVTKALKHLIHQNKTCSKKVKLAAIIPYLLMTCNFHIHHTNSLQLIVAQKLENGETAIEQRNASDFLEFSSNVISIDD